jgi:hypothetical protein
MSGKLNLIHIIILKIMLNLYYIAAPQIAAATSGDCTFEVDECGWSNIGSRERLDDIDWERTSGAALRSTAHDHTLGTEKGILSFLKYYTNYFKSNKIQYYNNLTHKHLS